jgi:hypothetical protein
MEKSLFFHYFFHQLEFEGLLNFRPERTAVWLDFSFSDPLCAPFFFGKGSFKRKRRYRCLRSAIFAGIIISAQKLTAKIINYEISTQTNKQLRTNQQKSQKIMEKSLFFSLFFPST